MNNTKKRRTTLAAIAAVLIAATLVVGVGTFAVTATQSAYAVAGREENSKNGNTITIQKCKQAAIQSGWDNTQEQECANLLCTHPGSGATCVSEPGKVTPPTPTTETLLVKKEVVCKDDLVKSIIRDKCPKPEDFQITVTGNHPDPASFDGSENGTLVTLGVGPYKVSEEELKGFDASFSADCTGTIAPGDQKTCTVTNTEEEDMKGHYY